MMPSLPSLPSMPSTPSIQTRRSLPVNFATRDLEQFSTTTTTTTTTNNNNNNRNNRSRSARARPQSSGPRSNIMYFEPSPIQLSRANSRPLSSTSRHSINNINLNFSGTNATNVNHDPIANGTPIPKSARRSFGSTSTSGNRSRSASRRRKKGHRHHRSHSELFKENESKEWSKRESKRLSKEMKSQLEILKTEIELLDKLDDGTISNQERETLEMISCKVALDHTA